MHESLLSRSSARESLVNVIKISYALIHICILRKYELFFSSPYFQGVKREIRISIEMFLP